MPAARVTNIVTSLLSAMGGHPDVMYYLRMGFRMKIVSLYPLTIGIMNVYRGIYQEKWVYLPHLLNTDKSKLRKPTTN